MRSRHSCWMCRCPSVSIRLDEDDEDDDDVGRDDNLSILHDDEQEHDNRDDMTGVRTCGNSMHRVVL